MKHITIIIPTRNRLENLKRTLASIPEEKNISIMIVCDGDEKTYKYLRENPKENIIPLIEKENKGTVYCRNLCTTYTQDGALCAMDSVVFKPGSIQKALEIFNQNFLYDDGVFGFNFEGRGSCTSLPLVGQQFLQRYPGRRLYCPKYFHFACQEISSLCFVLEKKHNKKFIIQDGEHLVIKQIIRDNTYNDARKFKSEDMKLKEERENANLIWGYKS